LNLRDSIVIYLLDHVHVSKGEIPYCNFKKNLLDSSFPFLRASKFSRLIAPSVAVNSLALIMYT